MHENRNHYFESNKRNITLRHVQICKHKYNKIEATYVAIFSLLLFCSSCYYISLPDERLLLLFIPKQLIFVLLIVLHKHMYLELQSIIKFTLNTFKTQVVVFLLQQ